MKGIPREVGVSEKRKVTNSRVIRILRDNLSISDYQKSILIGTLLGDGSLSADGWSKNYRLQLVHGDNQKDYLFWKFNQFRNWCFSEPSYQKWNQSWRIRTISHSSFNDYAHLFYQDGTKIVPKDIMRHLNPLVLAVWFMDDGTRGPKGGYTLNTQSFSRGENEYLRGILSKLFKLNVSLHKDKKWWRLYIGEKSQKDFFNLIESDVIPSMKYKLHALDPVETTRRLPIKRIGMKI